MTDMQFYPAPLMGSVRIPASKSQAHRALICAALAGNSRVRDVDLSNDITVTANAMRAMGAEIEYEEEAKTFVIGAPLKRGCDIGEVSCGESASALRFLIPLAAALGDTVVFTGEGRLPKRTTELYKPLLEPLGAKLTYPDNGDFLPLRVEGQLKAGECALRGDISSQFVTGLLLAFSTVEGTSTVKLTTCLESRPYADMTVDVMRTFGIPVRETADTYTVSGGRYEPRDYSVEGCCSQAAFFTVAAAIGGEVCMQGLNPATKQGDAAVLAIAKRFGASVIKDENGVTVRRAENLTASDIDAADIPDLVPALSVMAAFSEGTTVIYNAGRLRIKESDRIASTKAMLEAIGAEVYETADGLRIVGKPSLPGGRVAACNDHRIAMAAAAASVGCTGPVTVDDMKCINKSYPAFVRDFESLQGGKTE